MIRGWVWLLLLAGVCFAQKNDRRRFQSDVFNKGRAIHQQVAGSLWRLGNLHLTPELGLRNAGYDSNVFSEENQERDDFSVSPIIGARTYLRFNKNWVWMNRAGYIYRYFLDLDSLRGSAYEGESRVYGVFKRVVVDFGAGGQKDRERVTSELDDRVQSRRLAYDVNAVIQVVPRGHLGLKARAYELERDDSGPMEANFANLERRERGASMSYLYQWKPQFWPFVEVTSTRFDFTSPNNPRDDSELTEAYLGFRNEYERRFHANAKVGVEQISFDRVPGADDDVFGAEIFLEYKLRRRFAINGGSQQLPVFSASSQYNYYLSRRFYCGFEYQTRRQIRLGMEFLFGDNDYRKPLTPQAILRNDELRGVNATLGFPIRGTLLRWNVSAGYLERESNLPDLSDEGFQIFTHIDLKSQ